MLIFLELILQPCFFLLFDLLTVIFFHFDFTLIILNLKSLIFTFLSCHLPQLLIFSVDLCLLFLIHLILFLLFIDQIFKKIFRIYYSLPFVEIFYILKSFHQLHFPLRIIRFVFQVLHRIFLFLMHLQPFQVLFSLLCIFNSLIVPRASRLYNIIMVFGVSFKCDFTIAIGTFEVETENFNPEIGLLVTNLHSHVKFGTNIQIVGAGIAPQTHRQHVSHHHELVLTSTSLDNTRMVEVFGEIFDKYFSLCHIIIINYTLFQNQHWKLINNQIKVINIIEQYLHAVFMSVIKAVQEQQNQKIQLRTVMKGAITITSEELNRMKMKANLLPNPDSEDNHPVYQLQQSQKRTDHWADNPKSLKQRKEEQRFKKFEKQQLERRRIDEQERKFQQKLKEEELAKANAKLFQETEQVRGLNSKLLFSDTLKGREDQIEIKKYLQEIEKQKEEHFHQQTMNQIAKAEEEEKKKKLEEKQKLKKFQKNLKKQHKQVIKQYVNKYKQEMEEGELLRLKAEAAIKEEQEKEKQRRAKNMLNRKEIDVINEKNKELKAIEAQKEKQQESKIEEYRKKQEIIQDLTKKRQQDLINEKIKQREQLYKQQSFKMSQIKNNEVERLSSQIEQLEKKQAQIERKKNEEKKLLKQQYQESLKDQVQRRKREKQQQIEDNHKFKQTWKDKLTTLKEQEDQEQKFRKNLYNKNADDLKRQMEQKRIKRQQKFKQELLESEQAKANIQNQEKQFKSYAQKCLKEWEANGKNLYPIIKQLSATMKQS